MSTDRFSRALAANSVESVSRPRGLVAFLRRLSKTLDRAGQRRTLAELTDHQLADIGLSRREALREASKRFWKP